MANRKPIEQSGRTVDDAVQDALRRLGLTRAQVDVEVLEEGRTGILGIGHTRSIVRVTPRGVVSEPTPPSPALPKIDDYADLTEMEPGQRRQPPARRSPVGSGGRSAEVRLSEPNDGNGVPQREVQPDHRSRSRQVAPPQSTRSGRERSRASVGRRRRRAETEDRQPVRAPIGPFELLADPDYEPNEQPRAFAVELLMDVVRQLGFDVSVTARDPATPMDGLGHATSVLDVKPVGDEDLGLLIGRHGTHVAALQYVVNVILSRALEGNHPVTVDVDGYRRRRETALQDMAQRAAAEVRERRAPITLGVMPPAERRIIHLQLQDESDLRTESFGEGTSRRVRILYRDG